MKILALAALLLSLVAAAVAQMKGDTIVALLAVAALGCAYTTYRASAISSFLKIFAAIFTTETVVFGAAFLVAKMHWWPASLAQYRLPESLPLTVAIFSILVYVASFIPIVRAMTQIADRYFDNGDMTTARIWPLPAFRLLARRLAERGVRFIQLYHRDWDHHGDLVKYMISKGL